MAKIYLITGPAGVGKSTISKIIAEESNKCALIEGDGVYHFVKGGYVSPWLEGNHLEVFWENCINLISNFVSKDYDVVFNYIIHKKDIEYIREKFKNIEIKFVLLLVDEDTIVKRDLGRPQDCQMGKRSIILLNKFKSENYDTKNILDTSNLTIKETVNTIIEDKRFII